MVVIKTPKKASSFLRPVDSRKRKVKVSTPVINTPTHSGILKTDTTANQFIYAEEFCLSGSFTFIFFNTLPTVTNSEGDIHSEHDLLFPCWFDCHWLGIKYWVYYQLGCWDSSLVECQTQGQKVTGANPSRSSRKIFYSQVNFLCWLLFGVCSTPVTAVAHKRHQ